MFPRLYSLHPTPYTLHSTLYTIRLIAYFATSTLQNELLVIIDQQKVDFILIFAAEIKKMQKTGAFFSVFFMRKIGLSSASGNGVITGKVGV